MKRGILCVSVIMNINYYRDWAPRNHTIRHIIVLYYYYGICIVYFVVINASSIEKHFLTRLLCSYLVCKKKEPRLLLRRIHFVLT